MKKTLENKVKLFAQYWGVPVMRDQGKSVVNEYNVSYLDDQRETHWLELTPISSITDEDAMEVCQIISQHNFHQVEVPKHDRHMTIIATTDKVGSHYGEVHIYSDGIIQWEYQNKDKYPNELALLQAYDYLRSKGYALPYNGLSVKEQVEYGWVKLIK